MNRELFFVLVVAFCVLLSGSIKIKFDQTASFDGLLESIIVIENPDNLQSFYCDVLEQNFQKRGTVLSFECNAILGLNTTIVAREQLPEDVFYKQSGFFSTKYFLDLGKYQQLVKIADGQSTTTISSVELVYRIKMPGTIIRTTIGSIEDNLVLISLSDLEQLNSGELENLVESDEPSPLFFVLFGALVFAALSVSVGLIFVFIVKKQKSSGIVQQPELHPFAPKKAFFWQKNDSLQKQPNIPVLQKSVPLIDASVQMSIFSPEEEQDIATLVLALQKDKKNYSPLQVKQVILEKGYSKIVSDEVAKRLFGQSD